MPVECTIMSYGDHPSQFIETWAPSGGAPVGSIALIHGGWWRDVYDKTLMDPLAEWLAERGWAVHNLEYRRTGDDGGGWPTTFDDVDAALGVVGGTPFLAGHSAGGHLALLAAHRRRIAGVIALAPITDPARCVDEDLGGGATQIFFDGADPRGETYHAGSPAALGTADVPTLVVHGSVDSRVPIEHSRAFAAANSAELWEYPGEEHFFVIEPEHEVWTRLVSWMLAR